ncbi:MgtC/SapB family protein [Gallaecimonas mangrovi]|uniref:MgtC/SapB family protein n=1 Tax=Gallaecimonas mangrovi TaxID=2291597 RepID=UPI000E1FD0FC|nr:MgtC/SapB family protein [Gallaecimonas mangrovi]
MHFVPLPALLQLLLSLGLGLIIGSERGWQERTGESGSRVAGIRTFALIAVVGCVAGLLANTLGAWLVAVSGGGLAMLLSVAYWLDAKGEHDYGLTTQVSALLTWSLGVAVTQGLATEAVATAVIAAVVLHLKERMHQWLMQLSSDDFRAILQLLVVALVLLPIVPNRQLGPWGALNPYTLWWMVVLIACLSLIGYFSLRLIGPDKGVLVTSLFGGLASSTATTLSLSRLGQRFQRPQLLAAGIVTACAIMFIRMLVVVALVNENLLPALWLPLGAMFLVSMAVALALWHQSRGHVGQTGVEKPAPFQLWPALKFGLLLAAIMLLSSAISHWFGEQKLWLVAVAAGLADVDAITLSLAKMASDDISTTTASFNIVLAALANTLVKTGLALYAGGWNLGRYVLLGLGSAMGVAVLLMLIGL